MEAGTNACTLQGRWQSVLVPIPNGYIKQSHENRTAACGGFCWWKCWDDWKDGKPVGRTEDFSMSYLPLAFAGGKAHAALNWRVHRNPKWCFLKWAWDYIKTHRSKKQKTEFCSLDLSHHKLQSCPLQCLKCFSAWSLLSQRVIPDPTIQVYKMMPTF